MIVRWNTFHVLDGFLANKEHKSQNIIILKSKDENNKQDLRRPRK